MRRVSNLLCLTIFTLLLTHLNATAEPMKFSMIYNNHTNDIVADGEITAQTPNDFLQFLEEFPVDGYTVIVHLNSPGGDLLGGMLLGAKFRANRFGTTVGALSNGKFIAGECYSACGYAFLGGRFRQTQQHNRSTLSQIGFHQFLVDYESDGAFDPMARLQEYQSDSQYISSLIFEYIAAMGIDNRLYSAINRTSPDNMFKPSRSERLKFNIDTRDAYYGFQFEPRGSGVIAYAVNDSNESGNQRIGKVTTYCRGGQPIVLLSAKNNTYPLKDHVVEMFRQTAVEFVFWSEGRSIRVPNSHIHFETTSEEMIEVQIPIPVVDMFATSNGITAQLDVPNVMGRYSAKIEMEESDRDKIASSFRHCVR